MTTKTATSPRPSRPPYRPLVYICSPYAGDTERNTERARAYCRFAVEQGAIPFAPHLLFPQFLDDNNIEERSLAMFMNKILQGKCDEVWVLGRVITKGMKQELDLAYKRKQSIRFFDADLKEYVE